MNAALTALVSVLPLGPLKPRMLNLLGHRVHSTARIGLSLVWTPRLVMGPHARIGHLNLIRCRSLWMSQRASIKLLNRITGPFSVRMGAGGFMGTCNAVIGGGAPQGVPVWPVLRIGPQAEFTTFITADCTENITLRRGVVLAGRGIQIWTHGFAHRQNFGGRELLRGPVKIGRNVYVGAMSCINLGVTIGDDVTIGSLTSVSKSLPEPGLYVSSPVRHIRSTADERLARMDARAGPGGTAYYRPNG
jgi:hypothetical protein